MTSYRKLCEVHPELFAELPVRGELHTAIRVEYTRMHLPLENRPPEVYWMLIKLCIEHGLPSYFPGDVVTHDLNAILEHDLQVNPFLWSLGENGTHLCMPNLPGNLTPEDILKTSYRNNHHYWWDGIGFRKVTLEEADELFREVVGETEEAA